MRTITLLLLLICIISCGEKERQKVASEGSGSLAMANAPEPEADAEKFIRDYIAAVNSDNWESEVPKFLGSDSEAFIKEHKVFRSSFPNYEAKIKHLMAEGNDVLLWLEISANYAVDYSLENSEYGDEMLNGIKADNQPLTWNETWYFDVVDGKFGGKWDFLKDRYGILEQLGDK